MPRDESKFASKTQLVGQWLQTNAVVKRSNTINFFKFLVKFDGSKDMLDCEAKNSVMHNLFMI